MTTQERNVLRRLRYRMMAPHNNVIPDRGTLNHWLLIAAQSPLMTWVDEQTYSSPDLTSFYVGQFCRMNHLKG